MQNGSRGRRTDFLCRKKEDLGRDYPSDVAFNAACTGRYFIHNLSYTNEKLLLAAKEMGMTLIDVGQGYTKCSIVVVAEDAIITYDEGIIRACSKYPELEVLQVSPVLSAWTAMTPDSSAAAAAEWETRCSFNGDLFAHPDFQRIVTFIEKRGLTCRWFPDYKLTDIGSIL